MRIIASWCVALGMTVFVGGVAGAAAKPDTLTHKESAAGWKLLFDGKDLNGWEPLSTTKPPANGDWSVSDGAIVCPGTSPGWLASTEQYSDFELKLQFRGTEKVNSGVFLRSTKDGNPASTGYELQIWDYQPDGYNTGSLVNSLKAKPVKILDGQWNDYDVKAVGDHFLVVLNGATILDDHDAKHAEGLVGLQCQPNMHIEFRDLKILPLKK